MSDQNVTPSPTGEPTATATRPVPPAGTSSAAGKPAWYRRRWVQLVAVGVIGLGVGGAGGSGSADTANKDKDAALQQVADMREQRDAARSDAESARQNAEKAQTDAANASATALKQVQAELASRKAQLDARAAQIASAQKALDAREAKVSGMEASYAANTIPGDGVLQVGSDIKPGTYKASASDSGNCYWARLASSDTSDIIDNGNTSGPVTITVRSSDWGLDLSGCNEFHRVS